MWKSGFLPPRRPHMHLSCVSSLMQTDCDKSASPVITVTRCANTFFVCVRCLSLLHPQIWKKAGTLHLCILLSSWAPPNCIWIWNWATVLVLITRILPSKESKTKQNAHAKVELLTCLGNTAQLFLTIWETRNSIREETAEQCRGRAVLISRRMYTGMAVPTFYHSLFWPSFSLIL